MPFLCARLFGLRAYGEIYGSAMPVALLGTAAGIVAFGRLHDAAHGYALPLWLGAAALVVAGLCFLTLRDRELPALDLASHDPPTASG